MYFKFNDTKFIYLQLFIIVSIAVFLGLKTVQRVFIYAIKTNTIKFRLNN